MDNHAELLQQVLASVGDLAGLLRQSQRHSDENEELVAARKEIDRLLEENTRLKKLVEVPAGSLAWAKQEVAEGRYVRSAKYWPAFGGVGNPYSLERLTFPQEHGWISVPAEERD